MQILTESELIGIDYRISNILWTWRFLECQVFKVRVNIIYQDNTIIMQLKKNGEYISRKRTQHYDINCFYVTDLIRRYTIQVI